MIRKSYIIKKDRFFDIAFNEKVSKVEIANSYNKSLRDKSLCKIYVYYKLTMDEWLSITEMLKQCRKLIPELEQQYGIERISSTKDYLIGIQNFIDEEWISGKHCKKIIAISEQFNNHNFMIPRVIKRVLKTQLF